MPEPVDATASDQACDIAVVGSMDDIIGYLARGYRARIGRADGPENDRVALPLSE